MFQVAKGFSVTSIQSSIGNSKYLGTSLHINLLFAHRLKLTFTLFITKRGHSKKLQEVIKILRRTKHKNVDCVEEQKIRGEKYFGSFQNLNCKRERKTAKNAFFPQNINYYYGASKQERNELIYKNKVFFQA